MNKITKQILEQSKIEGNNLKLPDVQLDRKEYMDIKKVLGGIGGKWKGGKIQAFVFTHNPKPLLEEILGGKKINLKKDFQFFATPAHLADRLVALAGLEKSHTLLEPSAGQGAIVEAIRRVSPKKPIAYYELMQQNRDILEQKDLYTLFLGEDFIKEGGIVQFDRIVANPPFTKNQDIDHVYKMYEVLKTGGKMVSIVSTSWQRGSQKKQVAFRKWLNGVDATILNVDAGEFKESGTNIETRIIIIEKGI